MTSPRPAGAAPGTATADYLRVHRDTPRGPRRPPLFKQYPGSVRIPLPWPAAPHPGRFAGSLALLGSLASAYAPTRFQFYTTAAMATLGGFPATNTAPTLRGGVRRAVPSGGAYYPAELYLAVTGGFAPGPGVYHYDATHHTLETLATDDPQASLRAALGRAPTPYTLLVSCRMWKNASTYGAFGYRLGCLDTGALAGQLLHRAPDGTDLRLVFDDRTLDALLGLDPDIESVYAVVLAGPPPAAPPAPAPHADAPAAAAPQRPAPGANAVRGLESDLELRAAAHPSAVRLHHASLRGATADRARDVPTSDAFRRSPGRDGPTAADRWRRPAESGRRIDLPEPLALPESLDPARADAALRSAVRFTGDAMTVRQLGTLLAWLLTGYRCDITGTRAGAGRLAAYCLPSRVTGLAPGPYAYDPATHSLRSAPGGDGHGFTPTGVLGGLRTATARLFLFADTDPGRRGYGDRWYRMQHVLAGIAVQRCRLAASAVGIGCRPVSDHDSAAVRAMFGVPRGQVDVVQLLVGPAAPRAGVVDIGLSGQPEGRGA
ncbi:nitroreductase family protein [Micromonospora sp. WMMD1102]|uniref:nitroreductase family protein n=1 Tax=Micromonospora sp. WMMD1102 TaxID=3016105 RepID=UPI002414FA03|nr:nitroreductase family protein [Micromonospora sp. WMMD1102]MDG4788199.1 nitroreductase family protein [Micromonospora sp. WMMD1102]